MHWTTKFFPWGFFPPTLSNLKCKSAITMWNYSEEECQLLTSWLFSHLKRPEEISRWKENWWSYWHKKSYLCMLPVWVTYFSMLYLLPQFVDHKPPFWWQFLDGMLDDIAFLVWLCGTERHLGTDKWPDSSFLQKNKISPYWTVGWIEQINGWF